MKYLLIALFSSAAFAQQAQQPAPPEAMAYDPLTPLSSPVPAEQINAISPANSYNASAGNSEAAELERVRSALSAAASTGLTPAEIQITKRENKKVQEALRRVDPPSSAESAVVLVSMAPGSKSPELRLPLDHAVAIDFVDQLGNPWLIGQSVIGNSDVVSKQEFDDKAAPESHMILVAKQPYGVTNMIVQLVGANRAIALQINNVDSSRARIVDRVTVLVEATQPGAVALVETAKPTEVLSNVLIGQAPQGSILKATDLEGTLAFKKNDRLFLRSRYELVSPAPDARLNLDGVRATESEYLPVIVVRDPITKEITQATLR